MPHFKAYRGEFIDPLIAQHQSRNLKRPTLQLPTDNHVAVSINAVNLTTDVPVKVSMRSSVTTVSPSSFGGLIRLLRSRGRGTSLADRDAGGDPLLLRSQTVAL